MDDMKKLKIAAYICSGASFVIGLIADSIAERKMNNEIRDQVTKQLVEVGIKTEEKES